MAIVTTDDKYYHDIAEKIRELDHTTDKIKPEEMADRLYEACDVQYNEGYLRGNEDGESTGHERGVADGLSQGRKERNDIMFGILGRDFETIEKEHLDGLPYVGGYAFYNYTKLKTIRLPESVDHLKGAAFQNCTALTTVELNNTLKYISANAFQGCTALTSLTIPASVKDLAGNSLRIGSTTNQATIHMMGATPPTISSTTFNFGALLEITIPKGSLAAYCSETNWADVIDSVPIKEREL